ncbi:hypothetical protein DPEC_G00150690 [Dallia pectoralis]|uniref:Uncharacterized protein n=1 Tax=Dallia pectoralis TaxID=75939 RepID=A0ACC2GJM7_DALPE|nr:hypothetical protein DPEC_G00150690 [Dallia pectoralis]
MHDSGLLGRSPSVGRIPAVQRSSLLLLTEAYSLTRGRGTDSNLALLISAFSGNSGPEVRRQTTSGRAGPAASIRSLNVGQRGGSPLPNAPRGAASMGFTSPRLAGREGPGGGG